MTNNKLKQKIKAKFMRAYQHGYDHQLALDGVSAKEAERSDLRVADFKAAEEFIEEMVQSSIIELESMGGLANIDEVIDDPKTDEEIDS